MGEGCRLEDIYIYIYITYIYMALESFTPPPRLRPPPPWGLWGASTYLLWPSRHEEDAKWNARYGSLRSTDGSLRSTRGPAPAPP